MTTITLEKDNLSNALHKAIDVLNKGGVLAYPTETFYGLGVKFDLPGALGRLYELKHRPREKAMPVIISHRDLLSEIVSQTWLGHIPSSATSLMNKFWPGPLTLLLPAKEGLSEFLTAGSGLIAVRVPGESFALRLARKAGFPITATSANLSGTPPAVSGREVFRYFDEHIDLLIDGGETSGLLPSTIVDASGEFPRVVREGTVGRDELDECLVQSEGARILED